MSVNSFEQHDTELSDTLDSERAVCKPIQRAKAAFTIHGVSAQSSSTNCCFGATPDGPTESYFQKEVQGPFFHSDFTDDGCMRLVKNADISIVGRQQILDRMYSLGQLFDDTARDEKTMQFKQRQGTTMVLAIRNWAFPAFEALEKKNQ